MRFEPTPQSIDISSTTIESEQDSFKPSNDEESESTGEQVAIAEEQQVKSIRFNAGERRKIPQYLAAAKPFTRKFHHLSHNIKFNKIKLKSFNNLAHQLHQTLTNSTNNFVPSNNISSQTAASNGDDEDFGWGSDFDEYESTESSLTSQQQDSKTDNGTSGGYLLEIGKSSCDFRAIEDVIQDQGTSGHFKRLDMSTCHRETAIEQTRLDEADENLEVEEEDGEDDEAELRSLEARQGFRQIRDKLKVILDQRLANYEKSVAEVEDDDKTNKIATSLPINSSKVDAPATTLSSNSLKIVTSSASGEEVSPSTSDSISPTTSTSTKTVTTTTTALSPTSTTTTPPANNGCAEFEDCQSHCSDESSPSSVGLDSNHSSGQDSGHSTQHSGYSTASSAMQHRHGNQHHHVNYEHAQTGVDVGSPIQSETLSVSPPPSCDKLPPQVLDSSDEMSQERRSRFLQNRLIINSKLESMFKSRNLSASTNKQSADDKQEPNNIKQLQQQVKQSTVIDSETRVRLLEQQRQISLKLKQKPRRKLAKRAFMVNSNVEEDTASTNAGEHNRHTHHYNESPYNKVVIPNTCTGTIRHNNYESLTKQLSMICLRQAGRQLAVFQKPLDKNHLGTSSYATNQGSNWNEATTSASSRHVGPGFNTPPQQQPKAAMSLRQLVKDVIDDCEKPSNLSSLTIRSDSLSSDLSGDEAGTMTPPQQQHHDRLVEENQYMANQSFNDDSMIKHQAARGHVYRNHRYQNHIYASPTSSLSLSSLPAATATTITGVRSSSPVANEANEEGNSNKCLTNQAMTIEPIGYMVHPIQLPTISMKSTSHYQHYDPDDPRYYHHHQQQLQLQQQHHQQQVAAGDQSISSIGSIDGLEYKSSSGYSNSELCLQSAHMINVDETAGVLANHNATTVGFVKMQKSTIGSYLKSLRELSRFKKLPKVKLITNGHSGINSSRKMERCDYD